MAGLAFTAAFGLETDLDFTATFALPADFTVFGFEAGFGFATNLDLATNFGFAAALGFAAISFGLAMSFSLAFGLAATFTARFGFAATFGFTRLAAFVFTVALGFAGAFTARLGFATDFDSATIFAARFGLAATLAFATGFCFAAFFAFTMERSWETGLISPSPSGRARRWYQLRSELRLPHGNTLAPTPGADARALISATTFRAEIGGEVEYYPTPIEQAASAGLDRFNRHRVGAAYDLPPSPSGWTSSHVDARHGLLRRPLDARRDVRDRSGAPSDSPRPGRLCVR